MGAGHDLLTFLEAGVPAEVAVAADSCVVFEELHGTPALFGPTGRRPGQLRAFSRLRRVVDLREQYVTLTVQAWTCDGLPVTAREVELRFSVARNGQAATQQQPYPFDEQALLNLVYRYWLDGEGAQPVEFYPAMVERLQAELRKFISCCSVDEIMPFVALAAGRSALPDPTLNPLHAFAQAFNAHALERGIELAWMGKGEWLLPKEIDLHSHLDLWRQSVDNWLRQTALQRGAMDSARRTRDLLALVREVPLSVDGPPARPGGTVRSYQIMSMLVRAYRDKLNQALQSYQQQGQAPSRAGRDRRTLEPPDPAQALRSAMIEEFAFSPEKPVLVIGTAGVDLVGRLRGELLPHTSNPARIRSSFGGVGRNVAENLARLGQPVTLLTVVGQDQAGELLLEGIAEAGVNVEHVLRSAERSTGTYLAVVNQAGEMQFGLDDMRLISALSADYVRARAGLFEQASVLFVDANLPKETLRAAMTLARRARLPICADPTSQALAARLKPYLPRLRLVTPNAGEAAVLCDNIFDVTSRRQAREAAKCLVSQGVDIAIVALAEYGVVYATSETSGHIPAMRKGVVDPTGAGDALTATVLFALLNDIPIDDAVRLGVAAASLTLRYRGAVVPDLSLEKLYDHL
jgi:pseudouridine kinase